MMTLPIQLGIGDAKPLKLLISLHDATPFHLPRLKKAEDFFAELGIEKITYLLVPEYHGGYLSSESLEFVEWCRKARTFSVEWFLHGYYHLEAPTQAQSQQGYRENSLNRENSLKSGDRLKRKYMTAGEGEFLALNHAAIMSKLEAGRSVFKTCLGYDPKGFVAPAWLFNSSLVQNLKTQDIRYTEDHHRLYDLERDITLSSPVITWATRTLLRKYGSLVVCPILERLWASAPVLRVAMHPFDFDHASTVKNIRGVLKRLLTKRAQDFSSELDFGQRLKAKD